MKITQLIYLIALALVAFLAAILIFSTFPLPGNYKIMVVLSGSMEPKIGLGSVVLVKPFPSYQVDDIVTYSNPNDAAKSTTHRIVKIENNSYITQGDKNKSPDSSPVSPDDIIGKVLLTLPLLGHLVAFIKQPLGFFLFIILPATIIIYDELRKIKGEIQKMRAKTSIFLIFLFSASFLISSQLTLAYYSDQEKSSGNVLSAASSFGETSNLYNSNGYTCPGGATDTNQPFGSVTIDIGQNNLFLNVTLTGATPNSSYDIWANQDPGGCPLSSPTFTGEDALTTNGSGDGNKSYTTPKLGSATKYWISAVGGGQVLRSLEVP